MEHMYDFLSNFFGKLPASLWNRRLDRASAPHPILYGCRNLLVTSVQLLHFLVLGLLGAGFDLLLFLRVLRIVSIDRCNGTSLLILNGLHCCDSLICWHEVIDRLTMS